MDKREARRQAKRWIYDEIYSYSRLAMESEIYSSTTAKDRDEAIKIMKEVDDLMKRFDPKGDR